MIGISCNTNLSVLTLNGNEGWSSYISPEVTEVTDENSAICFKVYVPNVFFGLCKSNI